jgi:tRNA(Ser,Leu) C12 N-acetylase TAN1
MGTKIFDFNLLVSCPWGVYQDATREIQDVLARFGDNDGQVERSVAEGIVYVKTCLDGRKVIRRLRDLFFEDLLALQYTLKWFQ